jgi:hypothetical protein
LATIPCATSGGCAGLSAATANLPTTGDPAVDSIRHSTEMVMMRQTEVLIPPPPAQSQAAPANGRGGPKHP